MARPKGQFDKQAAKLLHEIALMSNLSGEGWCIATSEYLSKRLQVTPSQVERYIACLKKNGKIEVITSKLRKSEDGTFFKSRRMRPTPVNKEIINALEKIEELRAAILSDPTVRCISAGKHSADKELKEAKARLDEIARLDAEAIELAKTISAEDFQSPLMEDVQLNLFGDIVENGNELS